MAKAKILAASDQCNNRFSTSEHNYPLSDIQEKLSTDGKVTPDSASVPIKSAPIENAYPNGRFMPNSRQRTEARSALETWRAQATRIEERRLQSVGARELLRYRAQGAELELPQRLTPEALSASDLTPLLEEMRPRMRAAVVRFLHLVAAAWADGGRSLTGKHADVAKLVGWSDRTARYWLGRLMESGALVVDAHFNPWRDGSHSRDRNLYHAGMRLQLAAYASGVQPLSRELAERAGQVARLRDRFDGGASCQASGSGRPEEPSGDKIRRPGNSPAACGPAKVAALVPRAAGPLRSPPSAPPPPPPPAPPPPEPEAFEGEDGVEPAGGDAPATPRQAAPARVCGAIGDAAEERRLAYAEAVRRAQLELFGGGAS